MRWTCPTLIVDLVMRRILQVYERHTRHAGELRQWSQGEVRRVSASAFQGDNTRPFALHRFLRELEATRAAAEHCEMCASPLAGAQQRHLLDLVHHTFLSICNACALAFGPRGANAGTYRLVPTRHLALLDFQDTGALWAGSEQAEKIAYVLRSSEAGRVLVLSLDPAGVRESLFDLECWRMLLNANPLLDSLEPDVEALLINRIERLPASYIVPIDTCSRLLGLLERCQQSQEGDQAIWKVAGAFFADIQAEASPTITVQNQDATCSGDQGPEGLAERERMG